MPLNVLMFVPLINIPMERIVSPVMRDAAPVSDPLLLNVTNVSSLFYSFGFSFLYIQLKILIKICNFSVRIGNFLQKISIFR